MSLLASARADAQTLNPARFGDASHVVSGGFGLDGSMVAELSYTHVIERRIALPFRVTIPLEPTAWEGGASAGAEAAWIRDDGLGFVGRFDLAARREQTSYADFTRIGASLSARGGYFRAGGSIALELAWEPGLITNVRPTDAYRTQIYPGAHSTWMFGGNGFLRVGVQGVLRIAAATELSLRAGVTHTDRFRNLDLLPLYAVVGVNQGF